MVSIVIPIYNEKESIIELFARLKDVLKKFNQKWEVIFIDDGSFDGSYEVLKRIHNENKKNVKIIRLRKNCGKSAALAVGFKQAKGDYVITMDGDLQDEPAEIPGLINELDKGYDLVSGWRKKRQDRFIKAFSSKVFNFVVAFLTGVKLHDMNCGLKAYKKEVIKEIAVYGALHRFIPVLAVWRGFKVTEKVVKHNQRKYGKTKFGPFRFIEGFLDLFVVIFLRKFVKKPLHLFGTFGLLFLMIGFFVNLYILYLKLAFGTILGRTPLLAFGILMLLMGIQFITFGILAELILSEIISTQKELDYPVEIVS